MALPIAYLRKLETALDPKSKQGQVFQLTAPANEAGCVDFGSNNTLSLGGSKAIRDEFFRELARNPNFEIGTGSSRVLGGTTRYASELERDLALYNNADDGLIFPSGYEGNIAIHATPPQKGDVFIHDTKIHASTREGMRASKAETIKSFAHNDPHSLFDVIEEVKLSERGISDGHNTVFVTLESIYSMDGDFAPLMELTAEAKRALSKGNLILILDEAHSHGMIGPNGAGLACHLGLENEFAVRLHTYGKAAGASGAIVLCNSLVKRYLISHARNLLFTTVPSFVFFATIRAANTVMSGEEGNLRRKQLQDRIRYFYDVLLRHPQWQQIQDSGVLSVPSMTRFMQDASFFAPIISVITRPGQCRDLEAWLRLYHLHTHGVQYPIVSMKAERVRIMIHSGNTKEQIEHLVLRIMEWAQKKSDQSPITPQRTVVPRESCANASYSALLSSDVRRRCFHSLIC